MANLQEKIVIDLVTPPPSPIVIDLITPPASPTQFVDQLVKDEDQSVVDQSVVDQSDEDQSTHNIKKNKQNHRMISISHDEFTSEFFDRSKKAWRRGKIFSSKTQLFYYETNSDSPFTLEDYKVKSSQKNKSIYPNAGNWSQCGYINSDGHKCQAQGIFYEDEIKINKEYDCEKFLDIHFCETHHIYRIKEIRRRQLIMESISLERQSKFTK